jgi:tape measure domain-containing protein
LEDNRTFWELSFTETGLTEAQKRAAALEEGFKKIRDAANAAAVNTGNNFVQLLQPMDAAKQRTADMNEALKQTASAFQFAKSGVSAFAAAATVALGAVVVGASAAGMALSKLDDIAVKAFGERTSTLRAYTTILGDSKQAQIEYAKANDLASKTELTSASTLKAQQALIVAGFRGEDLTNALTASMDVTSAKQPEERGLTMDRMGRAFSQIYAAGKLRGQELNQLAEAGVSRRGVLEIIGKGDTGKAESMVSGGQVSAQEGIAAVQQAILNSLGTKKLGEFATGAAGSMNGLLSNRSEALDILLKTFDGETTPAVIRYKEALADQTKALASSSSTGQDLVMMLSDFTSITANVKTMWTDFSSAFLDTFVETYNEAREGSGAFISMTDGVKILGSTLGKVGTAVGNLADGFEGFMDTIQPLAAYLGQFVEAMGSMLSHLGTAFQKFNEGEFSEASDEINEAFKSFASGFEEIEFDEEAAQARRDAITSRANRAANEQEATGDIAEKAVKTNWGKKPEGNTKGGRGGKGLTGFDITDLMGGGTSSGYIGGDGNAAPARTIQDNISDAMRAAGQASSAPSARGASGASGSDMHGAGSSSPTSVTIEAGAIVVSGVSDPMAAAEEAVRLLSQRIGRLTRAPGAGRAL